MASATSSRCAGAAKPEHGAAMAFADPSRLDRALHLGLEIQEAQRVRNGRSRLTDTIGDCFVRQAEQIAKLAVGAGCLHRVQIRPLEVLDEGELELVLLAGLADHRRDPFEPGELGGAETPLARHEPVAVERLGHQHGLEDAVGGDAGGELCQASSSKAVRGWYGFRSMRSIGISAGPGVEATACGIRAARPRPRVAGRRGAAGHAAPPSAERELRPRSSVASER